MSRGTLKIQGLELKVPEMGFLGSQVVLWAILRLEASIMPLILTN
jgi:hypothetical protein